MKIEYGIDPSVQETHVRKTFTSTGTEMDQGALVAFTITGRVRVHDVTVFCTETFVGAATLDLGVVGVIDIFSAGAGDIDNATSFVTNDWWNLTDGLTVPGGTVTQDNLQGIAISANVILTVGAADITDGTMIIDLWYTPITDGAGLA